MINSQKSNHHAERMLRNKTTFSIGVILILLMSFSAFGEGLTESLSTEDLISKLTEESNQGIGSNAAALVSGFLAIDDQPRFQGGIIGSQKPASSPVMRELVRRGLSALPLLIHHLADSRPTRLTVGDGYMGKWFADEYDARNSVSMTWGGGVPRNEIQFERYTLRVGDLCYVAVGQIVNRELNAVRYQPSLCLVVNSPLQSPALAVAVKKDWGTLTAQEHKLSLEQDSIDPHNGLALGAGLKRLVFYYPETGERLMLKILKRQFYDRQLACDFFEKTLASSDSSKWDHLMSRFRAKYGETESLGVLKWTLDAFRFPESQSNPKRRNMKEIASQVLKRFFPTIDPLKPPFIDATSIYDQWSLLEDLAVVHSQAMDDGVLTILQRVAEQSPEGDRDQGFYQCAVACICAKRLNEQSGQGEQTRILLEKMIATFKKTRKSRDSEDRAAFDKNIKALRDALAATKDK